MRTSNRSLFRPWSKRVSATSRTAVYGPVRTVVWEGWSREAPPYPDHWHIATLCGNAALRSLSERSGHCVARPGLRKPPAAEAQARRREEEMGCQTRWRIKPARLAKT